LNDFSQEDILLHDYIATAVTFLDCFHIKNMFPSVCNCNPTDFRLINKYETLRTVSMLVVNIISYPWHESMYGEQNYSSSPTSLY